MLHALHLGTHLGTALHDKWLASAMRGLRLDLGGAHVTKVGIDAPSRWPRPFSEALAAHRRGERWPLSIDDDERRADLHYRETDPFVRRSRNRVPLAVSVDKIGYCAIRTATLLGDLELHEGPARASRDGSGLVPLDDPNGLLAGARAAREDDFLDALICAFVARAAERGQTQLPTTDDEQSAADRRLDPPSDEATRGTRQNDPADAKGSLG